MTTADKATSGKATANKAPVDQESVGTEVDLEHCAEALKALGDPIRLKIVQHLRRGPCNVGDLGTAIELPTVTVSHHLGILYHAGIVARSKRGRFVVYSLQKAVFVKTNRCVEQLDLHC